MLVPLVLDSARDQAVCEGVGEGVTEEDAEATGGAG